MENKQKGMKVKLILLGGLVAIIIAAIIAVVMVNKQKENLAKANPELAKAMTYDQVQDGEENVDGTDRHVKFDAFFLRDLNGDGYAESIRGTSKEIGDEDTLYMELNVLTAGYLKDAKITVNDGNFYFQTALPKDDQLKDNYIGNNVRTIEFNQLNNGTQKMLTGIVRSGDYSYSSRKNAAIGNNINNYSKVDSVTLTGTYVGEDGTETPITKTVNFNIDWYGTARATIYTSSSYNSHSDLDSRIDEENGTITLDFSVRTEETKDELILKDNHVEVTIPQLNGYDPISVEYTGSNATANYNSNTKVLTIDREAQVGEDGTVTSGLSDTNSYSVRVVYPLEAYQAIGEEAVTIKIPVSTYYEGYNNPSEEFDNPYKSNTATATLVANYKNPTGSVARFDVTVGKNLYSPSSRYVISKQKPLRIYNGVSDSETDDTYQVRWYAYTGTDGAASGIVMKETENGKAQVVDNFIKTDSSKDSMENVTTNIGIAFSEVDSILKEDGWIKVYDEDTGDLLVTFTKADWNKYTANNPYKYELPVKHIRVETSETNANSSFYVYNIKELDDDYITTNYTREAFDNLQYIQSTLVGYLGGTYINTDTYQAHYEAPYSIADIGISNNTISTQITEKNEKLTITARYDSSSNQIGWVDGSFVVKLPEEIIDAQINDVQINNSAVSITSYELVEQDGVKLIKINTKNNNDTPQTYSITVDVDITPDPRVATVSRNIELYATNEESSDYYYNASDIYDVNNNLNTEEKVNYDTTSISMVSPNSLLTNQVGSNYDDKGSQVVSPQIADIKPVYAVVDQDEEKEATIGVQVRNNYASTISEIQILGKIPFEGNTYVISGGDLGSTFTTKMTDTGIVVPDDLKQYATVYYSENENPDRDLNKEENGWKTAEEVTNWDNVKTFLIDLGDYVMPTGKEYVFNYTVKIPNGLEFNQVSFSHHGVYFSLDTDQGKYRTQTEPNRLGFRIAEKYNLELTKYQIGKDKLIPGATYSVTDEQTGESKTAVTTANGTLTINNLYAEKAYLIKEIKTPDSYELNSDVIRFIGHVDNEGNLTIEKTSGTTKGDIQVIKEEGQDYKVTVKVEDEVKASIKIHKTEKGNNSVVVPNVKYKLTGYGLSENGRVITTNANGEVTISGLSVNQEYTLQETKADGYYLAEPITFKIVNNDGNYSVQTTSGTIENQSTTEEDSIPTITLNFEDEKIPTYSLQIIKVKKTTDTTVSEDEATAQAGMEEGTDSSNAEVTYLEGAKFKLYKGTKEIGAYTTDGTGTVTIDNLYQYIEGKDEEATYTLKEVLAPEGYAKVKDITFKVDGTDGSLKLINTDGTQEDYTVEGNTVKLTIEDSPSFKLIKKDAETQQPITNVKFAIYNVENGETPATNSKGEIIGTKETINGKEYYTVQTDEKGELTADLTEGLYKAVEVQAPDQYDIEGQEYYFGIGASREAPEGMVATWGASFGGSSNDRINSVASTSDGGYIVGGSFGSNTIQVGNETLTNHSNGANDGLIIKYNSEGAVEWANSFGGSYYDYIESVTETSDGGYIAGGYFDSTSIQVENETLTSNGANDGLIIKYNRSGDLEWVKKIGGSADDYIQSVASTSDGGVIVGGYFESTTIQVGNETLTNNTTSYPYTNDGLVIKYNSEGAVEWAKLIGGSGYDYIYSVASTSDGGAIVGGDFGSSTIQVGNETLTNYRNGYYDGLIIKYNSSGAVEWATSFGGSSNDRINSVASTSDGGVIVGGYFDSSTIQVENETLTNNGDNDGLVIKYNSSGAIEWAKSIGESGYDYIRSVASTSDGGAIVGGDFSGTIQVGNETLTSSGGLIIKYNSSGVVEWAKNIGESNDGINSVVATSDGGAIAGGYFRSSTIQVGNETLTNKGQEDGLIIKYEMQELPNPVVTNAKSFGESGDDQIKSIAPTSDGGYIAGGYFKSSTIQLEGKNGEITLRNNGSTSYYDAVIIKYDKNKQIEWATSIGGSDNDYINSVAETSNGGYIVGGYFESSTIRVENKTLTNNGSQDGVIIKYSAEGEVEWAKNIGGSRDDEITSVAGTSDGGAIVGGDFDSSTIQVGNETLTNNGYETYSDGLIIKYSSSGEVEWTKSFGGSYSDKINSVASTSDGGAIVGGDFSGTIQVGNETLTNNGGGDGLIIKYNNEGDVEWANNIGGIYSDHIESVAPTSDGGYIVGGYFASRTIQIGNETLTNNRSQDGLIIKYSAEGEVEWADSYGGSSSDYIYSVASTSDGGYIAGGYFNSSVIQVGNETLTSKGFYDCLIIKYSAEGVVEWAKSIGGSSSDYIYSVASTSDGGYIAGGYFSGSTIDADGHTLESQGSYDGMILEVVNQVGVPEVQELTVENSRKEFKITTDVNEIDGVKGGNISGEGMNPYETVKYGDSSTKEIVMTPDENYEIIGITVNGEEWPFTVNEDGTYTMPQFTNMTEDKHVEVTYALKDNKIIINKVDSEDNSKKLPGATFKLDQIEERADPDNEEIIGDIVANGQEYVETDTEKGEVTGVLGDLTNNGTYYFVQNEDGAYVPTNSKTYQLANGGSAGIQSSTANSYIPINLSGKSGEYVVVVNASVSSEGSDSGYATINQSTTAPTYSSSTGRFMYISGTYGSVTTAKDYTSKVLEGGKTYYLHLGYHKDVSIDSGDDQVVINSIKVYEANVSTYNFVDNGSGGYESNNQGKDNTVANSYIPIDLTNYTGKYNLTVNANVSSQTSDYGYATITNSTSAPEYNSTTGRFIYISGTSSNSTKPTDYTTVLQGGQMYYLHLGYYKDASTSTGDDKFTVNSVKVSLNDSELYHSEEITTNNEGQAITQIPFGKYQITEIVAPDGYELNSEPVVVEFREDGNHEFTIENSKKAQVIVHHYLKTEDGRYTTTKVAEDDLLEGKNGDSYTTSPKLDLEKYELEKDEDGNYVIPSNATGTFAPGITEVIYYYEEKSIPLTVHHYIDGTTTPVPLRNGSEAQDVTDSGKENEPYSTEAIDKDELDRRYELVETPANATGVYTGTEVIVTYYYKIAERPLSILKINNDGEPLANATFVIVNKDTNEKYWVTSNSEGKANITLQCGDYTIQEVVAPEGYKLNKEVVDITIDRDKENSITVKNTNINSYNMELSKQDSETGELLPGAEFTLTYTDQYGKAQSEKYTTNAEGKITLENLEDEIVYTFKETKAPKGYVADTEEKQFVVHYVDGKYEIEQLQGSLNGLVVEGNTIKANVMNTPSLKIVKQDNYGAPIQGVKFTITDEQGQEVTDGFGNTVGTIEEINGEQLRVVTTDENGVITENLVPGKYVLTEVQTPEKYELPDESERTQTIEITSDGYSKTYVEQTGVTDLMNLSNNLGDIIDMDAIASGIGNTEITTDGNIVLVSGLLKDTTISGKYTTSGKDINIKVVGGMENAINIIITPEGKVENVVLIKTDNGSASVGTNTLSMANGEYITLGMYMGTIRIPAEDTANNQELTLTTTENIAQFMAKYNSEGKIESIKDVSYLGMNSNDPSYFYNVQMKDLGDKVTISYEFDNTRLTIPASETVQGKNISLNNQSGMMIVNLDDNLKVIDAYAPRNINSKIYSEYQEPLSNGGTIVGGYNDSGNIVFNSYETSSGERIVLNNNDDGIIIKYDANGKVEWAKELGAQGYGGYVKISEVSDGYLAVAYYQDGDLLIPADETVSGEEIKLENPNGDNKTALIKYTTDGKVEWAVELNNDIDFYDNNIIKETPNGYSIIYMNDGYIIVNYKKIHEDPVVKEQNIVTIQNKIGNGTLIVHHYKENTTESLSADQTSTGEIGTSYETSPATDIPEEYELVATPDNASGIITPGTTEVTYYYRLKDTSVLVHHYIDGTETQVPSKTGGVVEDETIQGKVTDTYNTNPSDKIANNYEVVTEKLPQNANGTMTIDQIVVTYYYKLKDPSIEQSNINKESTLEKVTEKDQAVPYTITYTANVNTYIGDAEVVIVDYLPYGIVEESSNLDGGNYDETSKTITWTENITGIDSFTSTNNQINITKNISLVYSNLDVTQANVTNRVTGTINLKTPEKTDTVEDTKDIPTEFLVNVPVTKVWDDNGNSAGKRPAEVTMVLTSNDVNDENSPYRYTLTATDNVNSSDANRWNYTFANLPKYDANGNENVYTLSEELDNIYYTPENSEVSQETRTITNTFQVPNDTINVPVVKVWSDNSNIAGKRPASIDLVLTGNDGNTYRQTLTVENVDSSDANRWLYTFNDLPKYNSVNGDEITYTLSEENVNSNFYVASVDQGSKTATNTFDVPDDKISVPAKKYWNDNSNANGRRPARIVLTLTGKGQGVDISREQEVTVDNAVDGDTNTWGYTFEDLPKYDDYGDEVVYTINEKDTGNEFYIKSNVDQEARTVTNTFQVPGDNVNVTVTKVWDDNSNSAGKRPESVTLQVKNGEEVVATEPVTETNAVEGDTNRWSYTFSVPKYNEQGKEIQYTADEADLGNIYYTTANKQISGDMVSGYTITNRFAVPSDTISVPVTKVWDDNNNSAGKRPSEVRLVLTSDDTTDGNSPYKHTLTATDNVDSSDSNRWVYTFTGLPKYNSVNGDEIVYTLSEELNNIYYTSTNSRVDQKSKTITNTFEVPDDTIDVPVVKVWNDNNNVAGKRPSEVTLVLTGNDTNDRNNPYKSTLTAENVDSLDSNRWLYTFNDLPKYNSVNGDEITYTLSEENVNSKFYTASVDQGTKTVTNTFGVPDEKTSVTVTKIWDDKDNLAGKRPSSVTLTLKGTGEGVNSSYQQVLTAENADPSNTNNWVYTFNDLPKLDNYGNDIVYTVDELDLGNKYYSKGTVDQEAKTVTNVSEYGKVIVHHYIMNTDGSTTTTRVPSNAGGEVQDQTIEGAQGEEYRTNSADNIAPNYELVQDRLPANATGTITEEDTEVIYYYRLKTPNVTNTVTKSGTDRITSANQEVNYTITYNANVTDYIGSAEVTIVDTLPYAIDTSKANDLDGGNYDPANHTITWTENVSNLDSYNDKGTVNITKNIKVFYTGLDMNQDKITNNVRGNIKLLTPETTSEETNDDFESTIYKSIISAEKIVDKTEAQEGEKVTYTVRIKNDGNLAKTVTLADTLPEGLTFDSSTQIKVGSIGTVYTEQNLKNGIQVEVPEYSTVDVVFAGIVNTLPEGTYSKELKNKATLDNEPTNEVTTTVTKPNITAHKESDPVSGTKVTEGDTITYRIRVRNDGTRAGTVLVKDKVPEGTTFVEDSVRIGELQDLTKTAEDLENGISVTLGINEEKVVEFQVRVNKLADGTTIKNTAYINKDTDNPGNPGDEPGENPEDEKVPEEPEHTYVEPKEEQNISKTGTATIDSPDDEITYNINYTAHITDYEGNAKIVLVDQLPYEIDTTKTNILEDLDGGTYDAASKTITWEQPVENIQMTEGREVTINKQIKVVYTGISQDTLSIKNNIKAHIEYETPDRTSEEVTANWPTTTGFIVNIPVSKIWDDSDNKLGQRPTRVVFKLTGSDGSVRTLDIAKPGTANTTTTQDSENPNKWNDIFTDLPKYDANKQEIVYTLTEEQKTDGDLKYYDSVVTDKTVTNTNKYGKVTVHHYVMNPDGSTTETRVPDKEGNEVQDEIIEGKEGDPYETEPADNVNEKYELVQEKLPEKPDGTIEKYDEEKPQEVIYYYRLKPAKVIIHYLEKDSDDNDANNLVLSDNEQIDGHVDDPYNTDEGHKKDTITKDGKTYTLVSNSGNTEGTMAVADTNVIYYYLQNTKATVKYVEGNPETGEIVRNLEDPYTQEGLVGDEFKTVEKQFTGYRLIQSPNPTTINMTKEEQTLIYWYEPVYTGLIENHIDDKTNKILYTEEHEVQVGQSYNIPPRTFGGYDRVTDKDPINASGTMGEELVTVNYYYIKKAVLEVNYIDKTTGEPLTEQIVDDTKHEGDQYTTDKKTFEGYDLVEVPENAQGTLEVETDENGNITNNKTVVTYYYVKKSAGVEEHHIDILTGKELEEPTLHEGHVGDEYDIKSKEFLSYVVAETDKEGNNVLPTNAQGTMTEDKIVVNYYYYQPAKVIVHYVDKTTGKELEETNPETGELQSSQVVIEGQNTDPYETTAKEFEYYELVELPKEPNGTMKVEITKDENGKDIVNNTIDVYYYYEPKPFNIGVEKDISAIIVNGNRRNATNGKLEKVDIYRKSTENTSVQVEYKIKVMNTGEISGRAIVEDKLPEGMTLANNDGTWEVSSVNAAESGETTIRKVIPEIGAGETKVYTVLLNWRTSGNNMGNKVNEVSLIQTDNVPGFKDGNDKDNMDEATVSISVETGEFPVGLLIVLVALVGLETVTLRYAVVLTKRQKKNNKK